MAAFLLVVLSIVTTPVHASAGPGETCRIYQVRKSGSQEWVRWSGFGTYDKVEGRMRETAGRMFGPAYEFTGFSSGCTYRDDMCNPNPCGYTVAMDFGTVR